MGSSIGKQSNTDRRMNRKVIKSKDTVILHIGMAKTATTSIQTGLKGFTDGETRYARLGSSNHSIPLITAFRKDPSRHLYYVKRGIDQATVKKIGIEIRENLLRELQSTCGGFVKWQGGRVTRAGYCSEHRSALFSLRRFAGA